MKSLYVVTRGVLKPPELYIAVDHKAYPDICDSCDLQGDCDRLFGAKGVNCEIHSKGYRWQKLSVEQIQEILTLV